MQKKNKRLSYRLLSVDSILTEKSKGEDLIFSINDMVVNNPYIVKVIIMNDGNIPILETDFVSEVHISCPHSKILGYSIEIREPEELNVTDGLDDGQGNRLIIEPLLLNKGDFILYKLLVDNFDSKSFDIKGRIVGIKSIDAKIKLKKSKNNIS